MGDKVILPSPCVHGPGNFRDLKALGYLHRVMTLIRSSEKAGLSRRGRVIPGEFGGVPKDAFPGQKRDQGLERWLEIRSLPHQKIEIFPNQRYEIEPGGARGRPRCDAAIRLADADSGGEIGAGQTGRFEPVQIFLLRAGVDQQDIQQHMRACAPLPDGHFCARGENIGETVQFLGIARWKQKSLFTPRQPDQHRVVQPRHGAHRRDIRVPADCLAMEMDRRDSDLTAQQTRHPAFGAFGQRGEVRTGLAQGPFEQIVLAAADDGRRLRRDHPGRSPHPRQHPAIDFVAREQPFACHLAARNLALGDQFVELALTEAEIVGCFIRCQEIHTALICIFTLGFNNLTLLESLQRNATGGSMPDSFGAWQLIASGDAALFAIVRLSLAVSLSAAAIAVLIGMPLGAILALTRFPGRTTLIVVLNGFMGLPPVVVGLTVYLLLSRSGALGALGLLFTPTAMIIAQAILVIPIIAALTRQAIEDLWNEYRDELTAMDVGPAGRVATLLWDSRFSLITTLLAGFGRAAAEVGTVMIVGGNIDGFTRTMTTTIALETSKGNLPLAMGLGLVLIALILAINAAAWGVRMWSERREG